MQTFCVKHRENKTFKRVVCWDKVRLVQRTAYGKVHDSHSLREETAPHLSSEAVQPSAWGEESEQFMGWVIVVHYDVCCSGSPSADINVLQRNDWADLTALCSIFSSATEQLWNQTVTENVRTLCTPVFFFFFSYSLRYRDDTNNICKLHNVKIYCIIIFLFYLFQSVSVSGLEWHLVDVTPRLHIIHNKHKCARMYKTNSVCLFTLMHDLLPQTLKSSCITNTAKWIFLI